MLSQADAQVVVYLRVMSPCSHSSLALRQLCLPQLIGRAANAQTKPMSNNGFFDSIFLVIEDLGSANGTFVNGRALKVKRPIIVREGDMIQFGLDDSEESAMAKGSSESVVVCQVLYEPPSSTPPAKDNAARLASLVRRLSTVSMAMEEGQLSAVELERLMEEVDSLDRFLQFMQRHEISNQHAQPPPLLDLWGVGQSDTLHYRPSLEIALRVIGSRMISVYFCAENGTITLDPADAKSLWDLGYYGANNSLSLVETAHLLSLDMVRVTRVVLRNGEVVLDATVDLATFKEHANQLNNRFNLLFMLYQQLRLSQGVKAIRSGINYGCEYLIYDDSPDQVHAPMAILMLDRSVMGWRQLLGINRAVSGAKKRLILAIPHEPGFKLVEMERWQPEEVFAGKRMSMAKLRKKFEDAM